MIMLTRKGHLVDCDCPCTWSLVSSIAILFVLLSTKGTPVSVLEKSYIIFLYIVSLKSTEYRKEQVHHQCWQSQTGIEQLVMQMSLRLITEKADNTINVKDEVTLFYRHGCSSVHSELYVGSVIRPVCVCGAARTSWENIRCLALWYSSSRSSMDLLLLSSLRRTLTYRVGTTGQ